MTGNQMFILALLGLLVTPTVTVVTIIIVRVMDRRDRADLAKQAKADAERAEAKADAAYKKSEALVELGNHHNQKLTKVLDVVEVLQKAVIKTVGNGDLDKETKI